MRTSWRARIPHPNTVSYPLDGGPTKRDWVPTGEYDLLIELFDAFTGEFLASYGPEDTSELAYLPLEDFGNDAPTTERRVIVTHSGGGALGIWFLLGLFAARRFRA